MTPETRKNLPPSSGAENPDATRPVTLTPVGIIRNNCFDVKKAAESRDEISTIIIYPQFEDGLYLVGSQEYLDILFHFHKSDPKNAPLRVKTLTGEVRGVFSSRSPARPNAIGITTVRLINREENRLMVRGLDAVDGTPVLDIKICNTSHLDDEMNDLPASDSHAVHTSLMKTAPRLTIWKHIMSADTEKLLLMAGSLHGHYCPGLAMGVMASAFAMKKLRTDSDGLEDLLAIVETNNCLTDGVQLVTGCTFGNNSLIFRDLGKTAFTLTRRNGRGIRVISRHESREYIRSSFPEFEEHYQRVVKEQVRDENLVEKFKKSGIERSFGTLKLDFDRLFDVSFVDVDIPDYAPSHPSELCTICGESVMATRMTGPPAKRECLICARRPYSTLDGHGIRKRDA